MTVYHNFQNQENKLGLNISGLFVLSYKFLIILELTIRTTHLSIENLGISR